MKKQPKKTFVEEMNETLALLGIAGITSMTRREKDDLGGEDEELEDLINRPLKYDESIDEYVKNNPDLDKNSIEASMIVYFSRRKEAKYLIFRNFLNYFCLCPDSIGVK